MSTDVNLLLFASPFQHYSRQKFLQKLTKILSEVCNQVHVFGANQPYEGDNVYWEQLAVPTDISTQRRYLLFSLSQLRAVLKSRNVDFDFAIIRNTSSLLPAVAARFAEGNSGVFVTQQTDDRLTNLVSNLTLKISEQVIGESDNVLKEWGKKKPGEGVVGATYVDDKFEMTVQFKKRPRMIGYLGLLTKRKGITSLLNATPPLMDATSDFGIRIGGKGPLSDAVSAYASSHSYLRYDGFIPETEIVEFYNRLQLLVLPTASEGLPNVALEAMACGTPVLATTAGGLPDLITDGENGFLMESNSAECIERNVIRALSENLSQVSKNAAETIDDEFRFSDAVERYQRIITAAEGGG